MAINMIREKGFFKKEKFQNGFTLTSWQLTLTFLFFIIFYFFIFSQHVHYNSLTSYALSFHSFNNWNCQCKYYAFMLGIKLYLLGVLCYTTTLLLPAISSRASRVEAHTTSFKKGFFSAIKFLLGVCTRKRKVIRVNNYFTPLSLSAIHCRTTQR